MMDELAQAGISIDAVTAKLVEEGVQLFADAFDKLLGAVAQQARHRFWATSSTRRHASCRTNSIRPSRQRWRSGAAHGKVRQLWAGDARLWTNADEAKWVGWLDIVDEAVETPRRIEGD